MPADQQLAKSLKPRHLSMIAIAGVIGAGLFVGSGAAIQQAGPGILLAYMAAGIVVILVMRMLGEMAAANPETGSFSTYADKALGRWAGFSIGWLYAQQRHHARGHIEQLLLRGRSDNTHKATGSSGR